MRCNFRLKHNHVSYGRINQVIGHNILLSYTVKQETAVRDTNSLTKAVIFDLGDTLVVEEAGGGSHICETELQGND